MKLHDLRPAPGGHKPPRRLGRGHGSGRGKTAGRGTKGQKARAGGTLPAWFEGGQTPLHVRTPKLHGFKNRFRVEYSAVNLSTLSGAESGILITPDILEHDRLIRDQKRPVKILGGGDAPAGVTIHAHAFTRTALQKLEAAGSVAQRLTWPENAPVDEPADVDHADDAEAADQPGMADAAALDGEDGSAEAGEAGSTEERTDG